MKRFAIAAAAAAAVGVSAPAYAAPTFSFNGTTGTFEHQSITPVPNFSDIYNFTLSTAGRLSGTISSSRVSAATNVDFTTVRIDGPGLGATGLSFTPNSTGIIEFRSLLPSLVQAGAYTLTVTGNAGSNASYSGTLAFAAVPEPATWALMILGFGLVGGAMRRRAAKTIVRFA